MLVYFLYQDFVSKDQILMEFCSKTNIEESFELKDNFEWEWKEIFMSKGIEKSF